MPLSVSTKIGLSKVWSASTLSPLVLAYNKIKYLFSNPHILNLLSKLNLEFFTLDSKAVIFRMPSGCCESKISDPLETTFSEAVVIASPNELVALTS